MFSELEKDAHYKTRFEYPDMPTTCRAGQYTDFGNVVMSGVVGSIFSRFVVVPALPEGLQLNVQTGRITGTPKLRTPKQEYKVTGLNARISNSTTISFEVTD
ncbi:MAG: putative Ig domain-containing protein [Deltaproteobacteria bacterium]|nr:putative Ig domain-containing protein [Deltaproteobacteria bacterium]